MELHCHIRVPLPDDPEAWPEAGTPAEQARRWYVDADGQLSGEGLETVLAFDDPDDGADFAASVVAGPCDAAALAASRLAAAIEALAPTVADVAASRPELGPELEGLRAEAWQAAHDASAALGRFLGLAAPVAGQGGLTAEGSTSRLCVVHDRPALAPAPDGTEVCAFYDPHLGASEDYGCDVVDARPCLGGCGRITNGEFDGGTHGPGPYCGWCHAVPA